MKGTPCKGPSLAPLATALSAASAASNAFSAVRVTTTLIFGFTALMRSKMCLDDFARRKLSGSDLYDALINSYRVAGLLPA